MQNVHHDNTIPVSILIHLLASCPADEPIAMSGWSQPISGLWRLGKKMDWSFSRVDCWGKYLGLRGRKMRETWKLHTEKFHYLYFSTSHKILFGWWNKGIWDGWVVWHVWERSKRRRGFSCRNLKGKGPSGRHSCKWEEMWKCIFNN